MQRPHAFLCALVALTVTTAAAADKPNILFVLCDDLGYGDVSCLNPQGKIKTPHMDRIAREGMIFTDAHSGSAVCTPTRYGIVTGRYAWRTKLQNGVLGGLSPHLIDVKRPTVASFLKQHGYHTGAIGKWHLGMDWEILPGKAVSELSIEPREQAWNVDYSKPVRNGPNAVGFDYYFGISASLDMVPYTFIENDRVTALPSEDVKFPMYEGRAGGFCREGPAAPGFHTSHVLPAFRARAVQFIEKHAKDGSPFFLYLPLNSPHTPIAPNPEWQGRSGISFYADFVMETDAAIGALLDALDRAGIAENTLVIVTSDNGCSPQANYPELAGFGHNPSAHLRGHKADIFDGGHRVPYLVRWPARVRGGRTSDQLLCLTDLFATAADILGVKPPANAAEDSVSFLPALLGMDKGPLREAVVHHSINGSFAIRQGKWKLELCPGSGGWSAPRPNQDDTSKLPPVQLYDMAGDVAEQRNVQSQHPDVVSQLTRLLERYVADGRSTPGPKLANDVPVDIWKAGKAAHQPLAAKKKKAK